MCVYVCVCFVKAPASRRERDRPLTIHTPWHAWMDDTHTHTQEHNAHLMAVGTNSAQVRIYDTTTLTLVRLPHSLYALLLMYPPSRPPFHFIVQCVRGCVCLVPQCVLVFEYFLPPLPNSSHCPDRHTSHLISHTHPPSPHHFRFKTNRHARSRATRTASGPSRGTATSSVSAS